MEYKNVYDLPTLNMYYLQEFDRLLEQEGLFKSLKYRIMKRMSIRYFQDFKALPECRFMLKSTRRKLFEEHRRLLTVYMEQTETNTVEFQQGGNLPTPT